MDRILAFFNNKWLVGAVTFLFVLSLVKRFAGR
jgi:hypothetical protein